MPTQNNTATDGRSKAISRDARPWYRREPGLVTLFVGLAIMLVALILPMEHRTFAFYPALVVVGAGLLMTLRHGPEKPRNSE
jgi:hypothetical protein